MELLNKVHDANLVRWAKDKPEVLVLSGDLTGSTEIAGFRDAYPDRFLSMGMAEQNMLSWAGGMAREGFVPLLHTFAVFLYRRPLDQLSMSVCYPNLRVRLFGFLPGITTPGGVTHQAVDDLAVLRGIPNLTIFEVGDATDVESVLDPVHAVDGPVYGAHAARPDSAAVPEGRAAQLQPRPGAVARYRRDADLHRRVYRRDHARHRLAAGQGCRRSPICTSPR